MKNCLIFITLFGMSCGGSDSSSNSDSPSAIEGSCYGSEVLDRICSQVYEPVCGCDHKTYGNDCMALAAGIKQFSEGECYADRVRIDDPVHQVDGHRLISGCREEPSPRPCTRDYRPVCGCDGITYSNPCMAESKGVVLIEQGACGESEIVNSDNTQCLGPVEQSTICPAIYDPVCGCDGVTYGNDCVAESKGVNRWTEGECQPLT